MADEHPFITLLIGIALTFALELDKKPFAAGMVAGQLIVWMARRHR